MNPNKKPDATNTGLNIRTANGLTMKNYNPNQQKFQPNSRRELLEATKLSRLPQRKPLTLPESTFLKTSTFVCDECARPLSLYGENFIDSYTNGTANILRCLCNYHAEEFGFLEVSK